MPVTYCINLLIVLLVNLLFGYSVAEDGKYKSELRIGTFLWLGELSVWLVSETLSLR